MKFLYFLLPFFLFATVNEPLRCELFSGYRNDRLHWHLKQAGEGGALTYSELYRDLQFWENGLTFQAIHRDLVFFAKGSYAAFGKGTVFQRYANLSFTAEQPHFRFDAHGWAADATGYFGFAVNLTEDRTYKVILIPLVGYSAHFERLIRKEGRPDPLVAPSFTMQSSLPAELRQAWYGFLLGGAFQVEPGGRFVLQAGYAYHLLHTALTTHFARTVTVSGSTTTLQRKVHASDGGNIGQSGWAQLDYLFSTRWRLGFGAQLHYFSSHLIDAAQSPEVSPLEKCKIRWVPISGWVETSRAF